MKAKATLLVILAMISSQASGENNQPTVLLELFTSQGCYSCPPAEKLLGEKFVTRDDVLALEMHVDYWDDLVYWGSKWEDPYSSPKFTDRQVRYASHQGRSPFTPQAVIQGSYSAAGTNEGAMDSAIRKVKELDLANGWDISFGREGGSWHAVIGATAGEADIFTVIYRPKTQTTVTGGENKGKILDNHNVVIDFVAHGPVSEGSTIDIGVVDEGDQCAVIVQRPPQKVVVGAWKCAAS